MDQNQNPSKVPDKPTISIKTILAIVLIALAVVVGAWVLTTVNTVINSDNTPVIIEKLSPAQDISINTPAGQFTIPNEAFTTAAYIVLGLFLLIPTFIALKLLSGAISLLKPDATKQLKTLVASLKQINENSPKQ